jgi:hypothetical protein
MRSPAKLLAMCLPLLFCAMSVSAQQYPVFHDTGNPAADQAAFDQALSQYDHEKGAIGETVRMANRTATTNASKKGSSVTLAPRSAARQLASQSCIIPRDATWTKLALGDDNSSLSIPLGFNFDLYGTTYTSVFVNNNGNLTFTAALSGFSSTGFPLAGTPMVAPFWADVDTRGTTAAGCGGVYYKNFGTRFVVTWESVGYYNSQCDKANTFQVVIGTTSDPVIGLGQNVKFNFGDMNWTTGSSSGGTAGFGGTAATTGVNKGTSSAFIQIGRFGVAGTAYDGAVGATDGVDYLDYECYSFNVSNADNIPPSLSGLPPGNTLNMTCGQTATVVVSAQGPEVNQTVTNSFDVNGVCGVSGVVSNNPSAGGASTVTLTINASSCNLGTNTVTVTATDNGTPVRSSTATLTIVVSRPATPTITGPASTCPNGQVTLTASGGTAYLWSTGATSSSITAAPGTYTVQSVTAGCSSSPATFTVAAVDNNAPVPNIAALPDVTGECSAGPVTAPTATDNCYGIITATSAGPVSFNAPGTYTINWVYTDGNNNQSSQTQQVIIADVTPPAISCPGNQQLASCETSLPNYSVSVSDNCSPDNSIIVTQVPAVGTAIASGTSVLVTVTARDQAGNASSCSFTVTRPDITPVANNDVAAVCEGSNTTIQVLANDSHPQGNALAINDFTQPAVGSVVQNPDNTFTYSAPTGYSGPVSFTYTVKANDATVGNSSNGHYYEWVPAYGISWTDARAQAETRTYNGLNGYLVTITSQDEMDFVTTKVEGFGWMGASDLAYEGQWRWVTGPEGLEDGGLGRQFSEQYKYDWCGASQALGINGYYANWAQGEPNDCGANPSEYDPTDPFRGGEHYAHFYPGGLWNDFPNDVGGNIQGYIVEYGGLEGCIPVLTATATVNISVKALPTTAISASSTGICPGTPVILTASGAASYHWNTGATTTSISVTAPGIYTVTGTSNDGCVFSAAPITITQNAKPVISGVDVYIQASTSPANCNAIVNYPFVTVSGVPAPSVVYTFTGATAGTGSGTGSGKIFNKGITHVAITATNVCGNAGANFDVTVVDDVRPVALCKPATVFLDAAGNATVTAAQINNGSFDNCGSVTATVISNGFICGTAAENGTITMTAPAGTVIDAIQFASYGTPNGACGNFTLGGCHASGSKTTVENAALGRNTFTISATNGTFGDPCVGTVKRLYIQAHYTGVGTSTTFTCANRGDNAVVLTVKDASGNVSTCTATVTVVDAIAPVPQVASLPTASAQCSITITAPLANDNCSGVVTGTTIDPVTYTQQGTYTIHWKYTDASGNSTAQDQTVIVKDTQKPVLAGVPANATVSCSAVPLPANVTATDNCDGAIAVVFTTSNTQNVNPNAVAHYSYTITRTWTATDAVGNSISASQILTVRDQTNPAITCPVSVTINCQDNTSSAANGMATGTDNCSPVTISSSDLSTQSANINALGHYNYTITRTWRATDVSGNFVTCVQTITVKDVTAPAITCPASVTLNCEDNTSIAANGSATGSDICSPVSITSSDVSTQSADVNDAAHYNYTITRTWTATDVTGNHTICDQIIKVQDVTAPAITCPASVTLNCEDNTSIAANGSATGSDICSPVSITSSDVSTQSADINDAAHYNYTITRTWTATDVTGNRTSCDQTITVQDITAPSVTCPASVTLNCEDNTSIAANGSATGSDICSPVAITSSDVSTQSADINDAAHYNYTITRTWTATDVTGNRTSCDQIIKVQDVTAPAITCPASVTLNCEDNTSIAANGSATGADICSPVAITSSDVSTQSADVNDAAHYNYTITRTWTATDVTGNRTSCDQIIKVQDVTAPAITCPASVTLNCEDNTSIAANGSATGSDICSPVAITSSDVSTQSADINDAAHYNYTITRTWTATDVTGNHTSCDQVIKVQDVTAPAITCPASVTLNCQDNTSIAANGSATGTDICSPVAITSTEVSTQNADINNAAHYNYTITRTWTATDVTGNHTSCVQVITVQDVTAPVVATPAASLNATVECSNAAGIASTLALAPSATDNCAPVAIHLVSDVTTNACGTTYTRVRKWNFTDITGNTSALFTQTLTVVDLTAPVVTSNFGSVELCYDTTSTFYSVAPVAGTDNCTAVTYSYTVKGSNGSVIRTGSTANASGTFTVGMNTITWTLKDACGNATVATATVRLNAPITGSFNSFTVSGGNPNTIYTSEYAPAASSTITVTAAGGTAPYTYVWSKTGTAANFTVGANPATITATAVSSGTVVFSVVVTDSKGCKAIFRKTINVVDARCGNKMEKVLVCHGTGSASNPWVQICVAPSAVPAQLGNGSYLGACSGSTARTAPKAETPAVKATVLAYPNPSRGIVQVRLTGLTGKVQLSVVDGNGKTHSVREVTVRYSQEDVTLDLQTAASGIYTIRASNGVNLVSTRVVIAR